MDRKVKRQVQRYISGGILSVSVVTVIASVLSILVAICIIYRQVEILKRVQRINVVIGLAAAAFPALMILSIVLVVIANRINPDTSKRILDDMVDANLSIRCDERDLCPLGAVFCSPILLVGGVRGIVTMFVFFPLLLAVGLLSVFLWVCLQTYMCIAFSTGLAIRDGKKGADNAVQEETVEGAGNVTAPTPNSESSSTIDAGDSDVNEDDVSVVSDTSSAPKSELSSTTENTTGSALRTCNATV